MSLDRVNEYVLCIGLVLGFGVVVEVGFRIGKSLRGRIDAGGRSHVSAMQASMLGLLALLLGFQFAMASSRFDTRRRLEQDEVNAIGTAYLRAGSMGAPREGELKGLLREYVAARLRFARATGEAPEIMDATVESSAIEERMWALAEAETGSRADSMLDALGEMSNRKWQRYTETVSHVPHAVTYVLCVVAFIAIGFVGFGYGLDGARLHALTMVYALLVAIVLMLTLDLDRPHGGLIRVSEDGLERLRLAFDQGAAGRGP